MNINNNNNKAGHRNVSVDLTRNVAGNNSSSNIKMSDDEETIVVPIRSRTIHYGSLEDQLAAIRSAEDERGAGQPKPLSAILEEPEEGPEESNHVRKELLEELERRKKLWSTHVTTDDVEVKAQLRQLDEPVCLFGEGPAERRERLRQIVAVVGPDAVKRPGQKEEEERRKKTTKRKGGYADGADDDAKVVTFHEGSKSLKEARSWIAESVYRAGKRLRLEAEQKSVPTQVTNARLHELFKRNTRTSLLFSQVAGTRPTTYCSFSPNGRLLATASQGGLCKVWTMPDSRELLVLRGHEHPATCVTFHPAATLTQEESVCNLASSGHDGSVFLWSLASDEPIASLGGHAPARVPRLAFHPSGRFLGTCCHDRSWRLWDVEATRELLHQEGHSREVSELAFHVDGSLALTGARDAHARAWDLRTGRCVMLFEGHLKPILTVDSSPNGYHLATGSQDNTVKVWDLRQRKCVYTIPAHSGVVSKVRFQPSAGLYLLSSSMDKTAKIWNHPNWAPSQVLKGHDGYVMCVDVTPDDRYVATAGYEKVFKIWSADELIA